VHQLQQRLCAAGYLDLRSVEDAHFCGRTHAAVLAFQESYGLRITGDCDEGTWSALIEASWSLGERLLFVRSPNIRGDDVAELQTLLNRIGFDCGRVDGIYGPSTARAVSDFQTNVGVETNGICTPEFVSLLTRMASQTGEGPGIATVRETIALESVEDVSPRIAVGSFPGGTHLSHSLTRRLQLDFPLAATIDGDAFPQAAAANQMNADVFVGIEVAETGGSVFYFYSVPSFTSVGGRNLAQALATKVSSKIPEMDTHLEGARLPILRETRMPAVLCVLAPAEIVTLKTAGLAAAISEAISDWIRDPLSVS
jgi:N-acetylmuramoyl-L-alanine amidase